MELFGKFSQAARNLGNLSRMKESIGALAADMADRAADATDVRRLLSIIDRVPGIDEVKTDLESMRNALAIMQMGRLTLFITFDNAEGLNAHIARTDVITPEMLNEKIAANIFTSTVLSQSADSDEPNIHLIVNNDNFARNASAITADLLATALLTPIGNVPLVGSFAAGIMHKPVRAIAHYLLDNIASVAGQAARLTTGSFYKPAP